MVLEGNVKSRGYDKFQRAYVLECENGGSKVKLELAGSKDKPIVNPAFVFNGWGRKSANLMLKGKKVEQGKDFRLGHRHRPDDSDLIVWVRIELTKPVKISLSPEVSD